MLLKRNSSEVQARLLLEVAVDPFPTELGRGLLSQRGLPLVRVEIHMPPDAGEGDPPAHSSNASLRKMWGLLTGSGP